MMSACSIFNLKGICHNSCFGNIFTSTGRYGYKCNGTEENLRDCSSRRRIGGCDNAAGLSCGKGVLEYSSVIIHSS